MTTIGELIANARAELAAPGSAFEVVDEDVRGTTMPVFRHRTRSLRALLDATSAFPTRTYLVEGDRRVDFGTHLRLVDGLAAILQRTHGVEPGDRVAIFAANRWEWVVAFWAVTTAGGVPCAFNGWWTSDEFAHAEALVGPALVIGDAARLRRVAESGSAVPVLDLDTVDALVGEAGDVVPTPVTVAEDDPAALIFTSGTTGRPKAVTLPHRSLCGFTRVNSSTEAAVRRIMGAPVPAVGDPLPLSDDVVLVTSPLFHVSMLLGVFLTAVVRGTTAVLLPGRFDPERVLEAIERNRVTTWLALGSAAPRVCAVPDLDRYDTGSLTLLGVGGAPVSPAVQGALRRAFPAAGGQLNMGYASTESGSVVASIGGPELAEHPTSTGRATMTVTIELRDPLGAPVADGEPGEVHVRSPYVMLGYWNDADSTAEALKEGGWLAMGDVGRLRDGLLHIDARARDMLLVSAENVSPTEVEHCLEGHDAVLEAAVLAVDDDLTGDAVCAVLSTGPDRAVSTEELDAWCRARLAPYKVPTRWHVVSEPLPRTASGKLVKPLIRELLTGA